jgi:hypothetical protein
MSRTSGILLISILLSVVLMALGCGDEVTKNYTLEEPEQSEQSEHSPDAPLSVTATGGKFITVDWDESPYLCYNLYWNNKSGVTTSDNAIYDVSPPYEHRGLIFNGITYYYALAANNCDLYSESGLSSEVSAVANISASDIRKLTASDATDVDYFGWSVSISGDHAIVGAYFKDGAGTNRGAAYVFSRNHGGTDNWGEVTKLTASDAADYDNFGFSVSISGDYAIVGADSEDGAGTNRGAAYVFYRNHGGTDNWGEVTKLTASDAADDDYFGWSVSISGDHAIVGAKSEDGAGTWRGAAYVFSRNQGGTDNWGEVTKLTASDTADNDWFGYSVSISGDYAIVGADSEDGAGTDRGAAYVFYRHQGGTDNWGEVTKLTASDAADYDNFGVSVSVSGDYAIVGADLEDGAGTARGAAYVFYRNHGGTDNWGEVTKLTASDTADTDLFGRSVSISGDYAIVGAYGENGAGADRGAAYVFYRNHGGTDNWGEVTKLTASDTANNDWFGFSVSISGDYAIVGAHYEDVAGTDRGAAYLY